MIIKDIFIVEDDTFFAQSFIKYLEKHGFINNHHYQNVEEALKYAPIDKPQIIFLDHLLDGMNGVDSIALWKKEVPRAKIIVITSSKDVKVLAEALRTEGVYYFIKDASLFENIKKFLNEFESSRKGLTKFWGTLLKNT